MPNPQLDAYVDRAERRQDETKKLRAILLDCDLAATPLGVLGTITFPSFGELVEPGPRARG